MMIAGNPNIESNKKPKSKEEVYKLSVDPEKKEIKEKRTTKVTERDLKIFGAMQFNKQ